MVIVITDLRVSEIVKVLPILAELRREALRQKGYLSGNTLLGVEDRSLISIETIWESHKDWKEWVKSETQNSIFRKLKPFLKQKSKIKIYRYLSYHTEPHLIDQDSQRGTSSNS